MKSIRTTLTAILMTTALVSPALALDSTEFVKKASVSNLFEIETSKVAQEKAQKEEVKAFAERMIKDHTQAGNNLKAAVNGAGLDSALVATQLDEEHKEKLEMLRETSNDDFDSAYMEVQENAHDTAINLFKDYAENGDDAKLKQFAAETLPTLHAHEDMTDDMD